MQLSFTNIDIYLTGDNNSYYFENISYKYAINILEIYAIIM